MSINLKYQRAEYVYKLKFGVREDSFIGVKGNTCK